MFEPILFSLWLIPAQPINSSLVTYVNDLSEHYHSPSFQPHVTLFCGKTKNLESTLSTIKKMSAQISPLTLSVTGVEATNEYYKSVFITLSNSSELNSFFQQARTLDLQSQYVLMPHLSLLYQNLPLAQKQDIANKIQSSLNIQSITFDRIQVMTDIDQEGSSAVKSWRVLYRGNLGHG